MPWWLPRAFASNVAMMARVMIITGGNGHNTARTTFHLKHTAGDYSTEKSGSCSDYRNEKICVEVGLMTWRWGWWHWGGADEIWDPWFFLENQINVVCPKLIKIQSSSAATSLMKITPTTKSLHKSHFRIFITSNFIKFHHCVFDDIWWNLYENLKNIKWSAPELFLLSLVS